MIYNLGRRSKDGAICSDTPLAEWRGDSRGGVPSKALSEQGIALAGAGSTEIIAPQFPGLFHPGVVVQGFGNVGSVAARELYRLGMEMIAVADIHGAIYNNEGIDIPQLDQHVKEGGKVPEFPSGEQMESGELF